MTCPTRSQKYSFKISGTQVPSQHSSDQNIAVLNCLNSIEMVKKINRFFVILKHAETELVRQKSQNFVFLKYSVCMNIFTQFPNADNLCHLQ